jgi:hypothetical protein
MLRKKNNKSANNPSEIKRSKNNLIERAITLSRIGSTVGMELGGLFSMA